MRVLVTGASGGLGAYVVREIEAHSAHSVLAPPRSELDVTSVGSVYHYMTAMRPDGIIHLAALSNVDRCEEQPEEAVQLNVEGTRNLVAYARKLRFPFAYMSTNDVFSECVGGPFDEDRVPAPGMTYSWSKYAGEQAVLGAGGLAVRANFFTRRCRAKQSFAAYVLERAQTGQPCPCYTNVQATPVFAGRLAERIVISMLGGHDGVVHVCTEDSVNRAEQAAMICRAYGLPTEQIVPVVLADRRGRPLDARLASTRHEMFGSVWAEVQRLAYAEPLESA